MVLDTLKKIGYWIIGLLAIGDIILRLIEGSSDSYNYRCYCGITPDFIYWMILVSAIGASYALWYSYIRDWKVDPFNHPRLDLALVPVPLTLFFGFMMWACGDNPRYREDKVGEVLDKSVYEMYTGAKVPTPPLMSHFFIVSSSLKLCFYAGLGDLGVLVFVT